MEEYQALVRDAEEAVREAALAVCWAQWGSLGAFAEGARRTDAVTDPEALVLLSLLLRDDERRLDDFLGWWATVGAGLLSVQRAYNLAKQFPEPVRERLGSFARLAAEAGDRRWRRHQGRPWVLSPREGKGPDALSLAEPPALLLRLRAGFGVGVKADLLTFLLGMGGERISTKQAGRALGYTEAAVRTAAQEMAVARFLEETPDRPALYAADPEAWAGPLGFAGGPPRWRYWSELFAFLAGVLAWAEEGRRSGWSLYVWSSRGRDLCERRRQELDTLRIRCPGGQRGDAYLEAFLGTVREAARWGPLRL